jgi:hypothetical protein
LQQYRILTNDARVLLNVDGQNFNVYFRLLKPETKSWYSDDVEIIISSHVYVCYPRYFLSLEEEGCELR